MPSVSEAQARLMAACAHGAGYKSCPPDKVSNEFNQADKGTPMLRNAMRVKRAFGGPMPTNTGILPPQQMPQQLPPEAMQQLMQLRQQAGGNNPGYSSGDPQGMNLQSFLSSMGYSRPGMPPTGAPPGGMPPQGGMSPPMSSPQMPRPMPPSGGGMPTGVGTPQQGGMAPPSMPQGNPGALATLGNPQQPIARPGMPMMPMQRPPTGPIGMPQQRMMAGGGMVPPGVRPQSPLPGRSVSPLSTLIGQGMAGRHAGFPGARKPRIPLPGAMRNISQRINSPPRLQPI